MSDPERPSEARSPTGSPRCDRAARLRLPRAAAGGGDQLDDDRRLSRSDGYARASTGCSRWATTRRPSSARRRRRCSRCGRAPSSAISGGRAVGMTTPGARRRSDSRHRARDSPGGRPEGVRVHRSNAPEPRGICGSQPGQPVTSPAASSSTSPRRQPPRELERMLDQGLVTRLASRRRHELLRRCGRHRGRAALQALVDQHTTTTSRAARPRSFSESRAPGAAASAAGNVRRTATRSTSSGRQYGVAVR